MVVFEKLGWEKQRHLVLRKGENHIEQLERSINIQLRKIVQIRLNVSRDLPGPDEI